MSAVLNAPCPRNIRMRVPVSTMVDVNIEVALAPKDLVRGLTSEEIAAECYRRGITIKMPKPQNGLSRWKISREDLEEVHALLMRGNVPDALVMLERALPREFGGLATDVERFYARRS